MTSVSTVDQGPRAQLPSWLWLWMPLAIAAVPYVVRATDEAAYERWMGSESGFIETLTAVFLALSIVFGVTVLRRREQFPTRWLGGWMSVFLFGCIYFFGEEVSWGQHWFGWETPAVLAALNEQGETNFHNINIGGWTEGVLDQGPRMLLTLAAAVGGIGFPIWYRRKRPPWNPVDDWRPWLWPSPVVLPSACLALVSNLPRKVFPDGEMPSWLDIRGGESKECFLALFLMLYVVSIRTRLGRASRTA